MLKDTIQDANTCSKMLWINFKAGDNDAFEQIYRNYFAELYRYGMTVLPNEAVVKDAIQQLFVDLWNYKSNLSDVDKLSFYLMKSLRSIIFKQIKESKRIHESNFFGRAEMEHLPSQEALIITDQDQKQTSKKLRLLINDLPPRQREAILLIFFESKTYEEVSSILSMSVQSVYTLIWRSVSSLRKRLEY